MHAVICFPMVEVILNTISLTCRSQQCRSFILSKWKKFTSEKYVLLLKLGTKYIFYCALETVKHKLLPENGYCKWKELWILFSFLCCTVGQVKADCNVCKDNPNKLCKHCACHKVRYLIIFVGCCNLWCESAVGSSV